MFKARFLAFMACFAVNLVSADVNKALNGPCSTRSFEQDVSAEYIIPRELEAVSKAVINVCLEVLSGNM